jgi:hypothetical protein
VRQRSAGRAATKLRSAAATLGTGSGPRVSGFEAGLADRLDSGVPGPNEAIADRLDLLGRNVVDFFRPIRPMKGVEVGQAQELADVGTSISSKSTKSLHFCH